MASVTALGRLLKPVVRKCDRGLPGQLASTLLVALWNADGERRGALAVLFVIEQRGTSSFPPPPRTLATLLSVQQEPCRHPVRLGWSGFLCNCMCCSRA